MATVDKDFKVKNGLVVQGSTATVNGKNVITAGVVDAKGDLIVGSADDAVARLAAGTNGYVLTANSGATNGLEWAAPAAVGTFDSSITFEGSTADAYETTLEVTDPTADRTITLPNATGTVALTSDVSTHADLTAAHGATGAVVGTTNTQTLTNKTLTSPKINEDVVMSASSTELNILDGATLSTTELNYVDGVTSAIQTQLNAKAASSDLTTHTGATEAHGATGAVVGTTNTQTLTNKTLTSPTLTTPALGVATADSINGTTIPNTKTLVVTTDKLNVLAATSSSELAGIISDETGTGALVFANTPTLVTPNIGAATGTSLVLSGDLTVNGTTTTINSTEITVDDKNLTLGSVATPTDAGADGGGLTLKGTTDKTFSWIDATDSWTSSEHIDLASGKNFKVNGTNLSAVSETLTNKTIDGANNTITNVAISTGVSGLGTGIATFLATPNSANLYAAVTDEIGSSSGSPKLVFNSNPTFTTAVIAPQLALTSSGAVGTVESTAKVTIVGTTLTELKSMDRAAGYETAKLIVSMKKGNDIHLMEVLLGVDGNNNVYQTTYAEIISNESLGDLSFPMTGDVVYVKLTPTTAGSLEVTTNAKLFM